MATAALTIRPAPLSLSHDFVSVPAPTASPTKARLHTAAPALQLHSAFLSLPAELRNAIYHLLLTSPLAPVLRRLFARGDHTAPAVRIVHPALLSTCRQIHAEATPILYALNTFAASPTLLAALPFLVSPRRPVISQPAIAAIRRWYIHVRLDCDPVFREADATRAFSGADTLEIEASQAMYQSAGMGVLLLFKHVRGVGRAIVHGSVQRDFAAWLEDCLMAPLGAERDEFGRGPDQILVGGRYEEFNVWTHANR